MRGKILDARGIPLRVSVFQYNLVRADAGEISSAMQDLLESITGSCASGRVLKENLSAEELKNLSAIVEETPALELECAEVRTGEASSVKFEEKYDSVLTGVPGKFVVMLDRSGKRVPGTFKIVRQPRPGRDVRLGPEEMP